ncbi:MAG: N-acetylglucosamine-6-phosphate deacetylase [Sulfolobales archaeon]
MHILRRIKIATPEKIIERGFIVIERGFIKDVGEGSPNTNLGSSEDLDSMIIIPGFVDTHTHGIEGLDITQDPTPETLEEISRRIIRYGVTSFTPTTVTAPHEILVKACESIRKYADSRKPGSSARILGIHLEGPYISREMAGAQNPDHIRIPRASEFREYWNASKGLISQITIAPEIEGGIEFIRYVREHGVVASAGHTNASYEIGVEAVRAGISKATHFLNAMRRFHHRDPGISLALLESEKVFLEIIADMIHLHPSVVKLLIRYAGADRIALVTDSISATGLEDGVYELGGLRVRVEKGVAKLADRDTLAGSTLTMIKAFRNIIDLGFSLADASRMSSLTPARSINADNKFMIGRIERRFRADLIALDEKLNIRRVYIDGEIAYEK